MMSLLGPNTKGPDVVDHIAGWRKDPLLPLGSPDGFSFTPEGTTAKDEKALFCKAERLRLGRQHSPSELPLVLPRDGIG